MNLRSHFRLPSLGSHCNAVLEIENRIFTERYLRLYASGVVIAYAIVLVWLLFCDAWLIGSDGKPVCIDFSWIWLSGHFAASPEPARIYDHSVFSAARAALASSGSCLMNDHFQYPPTMFLFTYPFGALPYYVSFVAWNLITLLLYSVAAYSIIPRPATVIVAVTPFAVLANILYGHNAFLSAGLIALALLFIERRPWLSGIFIGLVSYKPQFGVLFPLALLAARNWRAFASAALTGLIFAATAAILFGYNGWISFIDALLDRNLSLSPDKALEIYDLQSVFGFLRYFGASHTVCWATHLTVTSVVAAIICAIWAKPIPYALKAASLCTGVLMVTPYVLAYDICILSIAVAFLIKDGLANGFMPGERAIIFLSWGGLFLLILPVAPFICAAIFYLVTRRIVDYRRDTGLKLAFANSMQ